MAGELWRLEELAQQGQALLERLDWSDGEDGRVRWEPNARQLRYYATLGLLDRPAYMSGRTAYYDCRHLLQLLAVKRLQQQGQSLQQIQQRLMGLGATELEELLTLPHSWQDLLTPGSVDPNGNFWEQVEQLPSLPVARSLQEVELVPGVRLQFDPELVALNAQDLAQLRQLIENRGGNRD